MFTFTIPQKPLVYNPILIEAFFRFYWHFEPCILGGIHKWRHANLTHNWPPSPPVSHLNDCFTDNFLLRSHNSIPPPPYLRDVIYEWSLTLFPNGISLPVSAWWSTKTSWNSPRSSKCKSSLHTRSETFSPSFVSRQYTTSVFNGSSSLATLSRGITTFDGLAVDRWWA